MKIGLYLGRFSMKKVLATILAVIYLSTSIGATVHFHYCMGKLVSWGLMEQKGKRCTFCGMPKKVTTKHCMVTKKGCCKDEYKQIITGKDQKVVQSALKALEFPPAIDAVNHPVQQQYFYSYSFIIEYPTANAPPGIGNVPVFILHRNFRI